MEHSERLHPSDRGNDDTLDDPIFPEDVEYEDPEKTTQSSRSSTDAPKVFGVD